MKRLAAICITAIGVSYAVLDGIAVVALGAIGDHLVDFSNAIDDAWEPFLTDDHA